MFGSVVHEDATSRTECFTCVTKVNQSVWPTVEPYLIDRRCLFRFPPYLNNSFHPLKDLGEAGLSLSLLLSTTAMSHSRAARESSGATCEKQPTLRGALLLRLRAPLPSLPRRLHTVTDGRKVTALFLFSLSVVLPYVTSPPRYFNRYR